MEVKETTKNTKILENNTENLIDSDNSNISNNFDNSNRLSKKNKKSFKERLKGLFTIRRVCVNMTKALIISACLATSYTTISSNINDIEGLQNNYKNLKTNVTEIEKTYSKIKKENSDLASKVSETEKSLETSKSKAAEVEDNLNSSKAKVEGLTEIVEKNATIR